MEMRSEKLKMEMPADLYDTLELSALANGGIGAGADFEVKFKPNSSEVESKTCLCAHGPFNGIFIYKDTGEIHTGYDYRVERGVIVVDDLLSKFITRGRNDEAVREMLAPRFDSLVVTMKYKRVSWAKYKKYFDIVRVPNEWEGKCFGFEMEDNTKIGT